MKKTELEVQIDELEEYVAAEIQAIKKKFKKLNPVVTTNLVKEDDLFSIISYSQVCKLLKEEELSCPYAKIKQIEKLYNGIWKKDWNNLQQYKYYPYFNLNASYGQVGFHGSNSRASNAYGQVAFYKDRKTSDYVGKTFWLIYKEILM